MLATTEEKRESFAISNFNDSAIFITGGYNDEECSNIFRIGQDVLNTVQIFDKESQSFIQGPPMLYKRSCHTATSTQNAVIVFGGVLVGRRFCHYIERLRVD